MMHWWDVAALRRELKTNTVSDIDKTKYLLANLLFPWWMYLPLERKYSTAAQFLMILTYLIVVIGGVLLCHKANKLGDGQRFIERFICISWPILVKVFVFTVLIMFPISVAEVIWSFDWENVLFPREILRLLAFLWIRSELLKISGAKDASIPSTQPSA